MKSIQLNPDGTSKTNWKKVVKEGMQFGVILWCISTGFGAAVALVIRLVRFIISL